MKNKLLKIAIPISLFVLFFVFTPNTFAATKTFGHVAGNWSTDALWEEGTHPADGDDAVFDAGSANAVVDAGTHVLKSLTMTAYTGTLSGTNTISVRGATASTNVCILKGLGTWTGILRLRPTTATAVIQLTTNGELLTAMEVYSGAAVSLVVLQDNLSFTADKTDSLTLTTQGLDLNGKTISGNSSINRLLITSVTLGTAVALTVNGGTFANADFRDITFINGANLNLSAITGGSGDCGGNTVTGYTLTMTAATDPWYFKGTTNNGTANNYNWSEHENWYTATNGGGSQMGSTLVPLPQDNLTFDASSFAATSVVVADMPRLGKTIDWSTSTQTTTFALNSTANTIYGGLNLTGVDTLTHTKGLSFEGRDSFNLTMGGRSFGTSLDVTSIAINMVGGTLIPQDNLTCRSLNVNYGTFDAATKDVNITLSVYFGSSGTGIRSVLMGDGTWTMGHSSYTTQWTTDVTTYLTFDAGGSSIIFRNMTLTYGALFKGGGLIFNNVTFGSETSTGTWTISGNNTFNTLTISAPNVVKFTDGTDTMVSSFVATGTAANGITITGTATAGYKLSDTTGTNTVHYCTIDYATCEGGATWDATDNCVDGGHNSAPDSGLTGWLFTAAAATTKWMVNLKGMILRIMGRTLSIGRR